MNQAPRRDGGLGATLSVIIQPSPWVSDCDSSTEPQRTCNLPGIDNPPPPALFTEEVYTLSSNSPNKLEI